MLPYKLLLPLIISKVTTDFVDDILFIFLRAIGQFSLRGIVIKVHRRMIHQMFHYHSFEAFYLNPIDSKIF